MADYFNITIIFIALDATGLLKLNNLIMSFYYSFHQIFWIFQHSHFIIIAAPYGESKGGVTCWAFILILYVGYLYIFQLHFPSILCIVALLLM